MLRFIIKHQWRDKYIPAEGEDLETVDIDAPELERILRSGGWGEGHFDRRSLTGVEVLPEPAPIPHPAGTAP